VDEYVVPNAFTLQASPFVGPNDILSPEDMTDYNGHGTAVASVAGGITQSVASQANLVIVKFRNAAAQAGVNINQIRGVTAAALRDAWDYAIDDVIKRKNNRDTGKFVINMSYGTVHRSRSGIYPALLIPSIGFPRMRPLPDMNELIMDRVIPFAAENDIVVTIPTGNEAPMSLDMITPQNLGTTDNALITVAGVERDGSLYTPSNPNLGNGGSISIYAAARDVLVASPESDTATDMRTGTSVAAPAVAGMAAYFFSLSELDANWPQGNVARAMKQFFLLSARIQRNNKPVPTGIGYAGPAAGSVVVACKSPHDYHRS
jgi:subtilisin family serine protease